MENIKETKTSGVPPPRVFTVGPDRVTVSAQEAVIEARNPMPDWDVREMNHVPVYLEDQKYYLVEGRKAAPPYAVRYVLLPWPRYQATNANTFHAYDLEVVTEREAHLRTGHLEELGRAFLMPFYPFLGLFWSGVQKRLVRFGYVPHAITGFSIFFIFSLLFGQGVFAVILLNSSLRTGSILIGGFIRAMSASNAIHLGPVSIPITLLDILLLVALLSDLIMRYSNYLRDDDWAGGFLEWLVPHRRKQALSPLDSQAPPAVAAATGCQTQQEIPIPGTGCKT
jgi:hypothetical protein